MRAVAELVVAKGQVHCPICTHLVPAAVEFAGKRPKVAAGQRCPRCSAQLDAAWVVRVEMG